MEIQLATLYGSVEGEVGVKIPTIQQQEYGYDCGAFA
jgi:hypothetical protein